MQTLREARESAERAAIVEALSRTRGNVREAARTLGVAERTVWRHLGALGLDASQFRATYDTDVAKS